MTVGGDVLIATPLANVEAPFIWLAVTAACVFFSWLPLMAIFQNNARRARWLAAHNGSLPWMAASGFGTAVYIVLSVAFLLTAGTAYWISRGGHEFKHRIAVETSFYAAIGCVAVWSWIAAFTQWHAVPALVLAFAVGAEVTFTVFAFVALPLYAGGIGLAASLALLGTFISWVIVVQQLDHSASVMGIPLARSTVLDQFGDKVSHARL